MTSHSRSVPNSHATNFLLERVLWNLLPLLCTSANRSFQHIYRLTEFIEEKNVTEKIEIQFHRPARRLEFRETRRTTRFRNRAATRKKTILRVKLRRKRGIRFSHTELRFGENRVWIFVEYARTQLAATCLVSPVWLAIVTFIYVYEQRRNFKNPKLRTRKIRIVKGWEKKTRDKNFICCVKERNRKKRQKRNKGKRK